MMLNAISNNAIPKIRMRNICKKFGNKIVLDGFNLDIWPGESMVIIGGSGSGKSVLLKCMLSLLQPDSGSIEIDGEDITKMGESDRARINAKIGMLFQHAALFDSMTIWENVAFSLIQAKTMSPIKARDLAVEKMAEVGLGADICDLNPAELSSGMRKRVGLARAIAGDPEILFFDEPTTGLDPIMGHVIDDLIIKCVRNPRVTGLSITHDMKSARRISDRITMLYNGKNIWGGSTDMLDRSGNDYVHQFINGLSDGPI